MAYLFNDDKSKQNIVIKKITKIAAKTLGPNSSDYLSFALPDNSGTHKFIGIPDMYIADQDGKKVEIQGYQIHHQNLHNYDEVLVWIKNDNATDAVFPSGSGNRSYVTVAYLE